MKLQDAVASEELLLEFVQVGSNSNPHKPTPNVQYVPNYWEIHFIDVYIISIAKPVLAGIQSYPQNRTRTSDTSLSQAHIECTAHTQTNHILDQHQ